MLIAGTAASECLDKLGFPTFVTHSNPAFLVTLWADGLAKLVAGMYHSQLATLGTFFVTGFFPVTGPLVTRLANGPLGLLIFIDSFVLLATTLTSTFHGYLLSMAGFGKERS
ncbi:MAG: hypothetical protein Q7S04_04135 [Candidatus Moranbacteria bacterium]|nr:hypothetical protein [Candidatus Moranbacteria bacterium]